MYAQVEKSKDNESRAVVNLVSQKKDGVKQGFSFMDNRQQSIGYNRLQSLMSDFGSTKVKQLTAVTEYGVDDDAGLTQDKKIQTKNVGEAWFRFPKDGDKIDTFSENKTKKYPKGNNHVSNTIEISDHIDGATYDIGGLTRAVHFGAGDKLIGQDKNFRKGKWTWHHKQNPFKMELVDMAVHKSFGHHGGFSKWKEDLDGASDD